MLCKKKKVVGLFLRLDPNLAPSPFVAQACSGATKLAAEPSIHLLQLNFLRLARSCRVVEKFDKNHRFFVIFCRSGPEKRSIGSDFSATRHDLGKRRKHALSKCIELHAAAITASGFIGASTSGFIGASSCVCATIGVC